MKSATPLAKIMIVDDRPDNLFSLRSILEDEKTIVIEARSGKQALELADLHEFALIFSDVQMEEMDGFEFLQKLRANPHTKSIPFIFVTAISKDIKFIYQGYEGGAVDYMFKPLDNAIVKAKAEAFSELYLQSKELSAINNQLKNNNKQLEKFSYVAAHDLKSPLGNIVSLCNGLIASYNKKLDREGNEFIGHIRQSAIVLCDLINGILDYHRQGQLLVSQTNEVNLQNLCNTIGKMISTPADQVNLKLPVQTIIIHVNESVMLQIFLNLFANAVKYNDKVQTVIQLEFAESDTHYHFMVSDNGPGVQEQFHEQIFELFSTLEKPDKHGNMGSGIGLSTVKELVSQMGGSLSLVPMDKEGFSLEFSIQKQLPVVYAGSFSKPNNHLN